MNKIAPFPAAPWRLDGRTAFVTGASSGIGRAIALALAAVGARVTPHSLHDDADLASVSAALGPRGITGDLTTVEGAEQVIAALHAAGLSPDILVSNVGVRRRTPLAELSPAQVDREWRANVGAPLRLIQAFAPAMRARGWGRVVLVGSVQSMRPQPQFAAYAATKAALANLAANCATQFAPGGVTVNCLAPGAVVTDFNAAAFADSAHTAAAVARIPAGRLGVPEDCAGAALLLCTDAGRYITGQTLYVDGGMSLG